MIGQIDRIVVALDAVSDNRAAIGTAARLAERWNVRLHGVFIEDDDLLRLADLPFARQVTLGIGIEPLTVRHLERQMHVFAERARRDLAASARRHGVAWSFEVVRASGSAGSGVVAAAGDFFVAGTTTRPVGAHFRVQCRWWSVEPDAANYLLAYRGGDPHGAVAVVLRRRDAAAERLLAAAARLAEAGDGRLAVLCDPALADTADFKTWLDEQLSDRKIAVEVDLMPPQTALHRRIAELHCRLVAVTAGTEDAQPERLRELAENIACDILIVR